MGDLQLGLILKAMRMSGKSLALPSETIGLQLYIITQTDGVGSVPQIRYRLLPACRRCATKEIGDVCTQAISLTAKTARSAKDPSKLCKAGSFLESNGKFSGPEGRFIFPCFHLIKSTF